MSGYLLSYSTDVNLCLDVCVIAHYHILQSDQRQSHIQKSPKGPNTETTILIARCTAQCNKWVTNQCVVLGPLLSLGALTAVQWPAVICWSWWNLFLSRIACAVYGSKLCRRGSWVAGLVEWGNGKCWLQVVVPRDTQTQERGLFQIMFFDVCYANLATISNGVYVHHVVVHDANFVHLVYGDIGTQTIEGLWMQAK